MDKKYLKFYAVILVLLIILGFTGCVNGTDLASISSNDLMIYSDKDGIILKMDNYNLSRSTLNDTQDLVRVNFDLENISKYEAFMVKVKYTFYDINNQAVAVITKLVADNLRGLATDRVHFEETFEVYHFQRLEANIMWLDNNYRLQIRDLNNYLKEGLIW